VTVGGITRGVTSASEPTSDGWDTAGSVIEENTIPTRTIHVVHRLVAHVDLKVGQAARRAAEEAATGLGAPLGFLEGHGVIVAGVLATTAAEEDGQGEGNECDDAANLGISSRSCTLWLYSRHLRQSPQSE